MASGVNVTFGAPRFVFSGDGLAVGEADGISVGVSLGSGVGDLFFFGFAVGDAVGVGEMCFFLGDALGDGDGDSLFVAVDFSFLCGLGVGVGEEKSFLIFSPTVSSAACAGKIAKKSKKRKIEIGKRSGPFITHTLAPSSSRANARDLSIDHWLHKLDDA